MFVTSTLLSALSLLPLLVASAPVEGSTAPEKPQASPVKKTLQKDSFISCCAMGYDYNLAANICAFWDSNCGGFEKCTTAGSSAYDVCLVCDDYNPTAPECSQPLPNKKRSVKSLDARAAVRQGFTIPNTVGTVTQKLVGFVFTITVNVFNEVFFRVNNPTGWAGTWNINDANTGWKTDGSLNSGGTSEPINAYNVHVGDHVYFGVNAG